ncbi:hypothetical protein [Halosolutus gelatinilyticus]|uniref:hypothetical protein n=1 Tax=Halosolutus gelatinilyticus TaxID=2931975 RepID=UPI001FF478D1|nr:hypothetical protein [Halosolutus gelatinilyticus]
MSEEHDRDPQSDVGTEPFTDWEELDSPAKTVLASDGGRLGTLELAGGGLMLFSAVRSLLRGQARAIPKGVIAAGLLGAGLRRRARDEPLVEPGTFEGENKEASDEAHTATYGREDRDDEQPRHDPAADPDTADAPDDDGGDIEFTRDEPGDRELPRSNAELDDEETDPRRDEDDGPVEIDVSESALADEASEAAGPSPEQAQPSQTDATEPEETPAEDASDMKVEPDDEDENENEDEE